MAHAVEAGAAESTADPAAKSKVGYETVLAVAGALIAVGFFLPWFDLPGDGGRVSGLDIVRGGGVWTGLAAVPVLGLVTAVFGGLRWRLSRWAGLLTAVATIVPVAYLLVMNWPWLYTIPLVLGVAVVVLGKLGRGPWLNLPLGGALLVASVVGPLVAGDEPVFDFAKKDEAAAVEKKGEGETKSEGEKKSEGEGEKKSEGETKSESEGETKGEGETKSESESEGETKGESESSPMGAAPVLTLGVGLGMVDGLGFVLAAPLVALGLLIPFCAVWLLWTGFRKKNLERPQVFAGWSIIGLTAYVAALVSFGPTLMTSTIGLWMTALGGCVLLLGSRPFATRKKKAPKVKQSKADKKAEKARAKAEKAAEKAAAKATEGAPESAKDADDAKPAGDAKTAAKDGAKDDKAAKLAAAKAKKIAELKKKRAAIQKAAADEAAAEKAAEKAASKDEAAIAKAGAKLASEPEPAFAADPTKGAPPPENEDREALMKRMGVKKPPPPSDNELEDMLAALKKKAGD